MPYRSRAQQAYFNIHRKELERQGVDVDEWNRASKGKKLPARKAEGGATLDPVGAMLRRYLMDELQHVKRDTWPNQDRIERPAPSQTQRFRAYEPFDARLGYGVPPEFEPFTGETDLPMGPPPRPAADFGEPPQFSFQYPFPHDPNPMAPPSRDFPMAPQRQAGGPVEDTSIGDPNLMWRDPIPALWGLGKSLYQGLEQGAKEAIETGGHYGQTGEYIPKAVFDEALGAASLGTFGAARGALGTFGGKLKSGVESAIAEGPKAAPAGDWLGFLVNRPGVKKSELMDMLGVDENTPKEQIDAALRSAMEQRFKPPTPPEQTSHIPEIWRTIGHEPAPAAPAPTGPQKISKDELANFARQNRLEYTESLYKETPLMEYERAMVEKYGPDFSYDRRWTPEEAAEYQRLQNESYNRTSYPATAKYSTYQLPQNVGHNQGPSIPSNYTERVVNLKPRIPEADLLDYAKGMAKERDYYGRTGSAEEYWNRLSDAERKDWLKEAERELTRIPSHYNDPHYNLHMRENDRMVGNMKSRNMEELQSDLYQRIRDQGVFNPREMALAEQEYKKLEAQYRTADKSFRDNLSREIRAQRVDDFTGMTPEQVDAYYEANDLLYRAANMVGSPERQAQILPKLPEHLQQQFGVLRDLHKAQTDMHRKYTDLMEAMGTPNVPLKNTTQWAGLAMKRLLREAAEGDNYQMISWVPGEEQTARYWGTAPRRLQHGLSYVPEKKGGVLYGFGDEAGGNRHNMTKKYVSPEKLKTIVGEEVAQKLIDAKTTGRDAYYQPVVKLDQPMDINLHGMQGFYDKVLVNVANDLGKKYGTKVARKEIEIPLTQREIDQLPMDQRELIRQQGVRPTRKTFLWTMEIPPKMREAIMKQSDPKLSGMYKAGGAVIKRAMGGVIPKTPNLVKGGLLHSDVAGRTDDLSISVPSGAYVIPADIVAGEGQGNTIAGSKKIHSMFSGPMGLPTLKKKARQGKISAGHKGRIRAGHLPRGSRIRAMEGPFAEGGAPEMPPEMSEGEPTPILAAGGEYIVHPHIVRKLGRGDMKTGHRILDAFVLHARKQHIQQIKNLKPPVKT